MIGVFILEEKKQFVFFHIGDDISIPRMLVQTIRITNYNAQIIQCSDKFSPPIPGVDILHRDNLDPSYLMLSRLRAFCSLGLSGPAVYVDTDMLVMRPIDILDILKDKRASFCTRSFNLEGKFVGQQRGLDFSEYGGNDLGEVFPYVACTTVTRDFTVWCELIEILRGLSDKFSIWYGDQEAMKLWANLNYTELKTHPEYELGCLPEEKEYLSGAKILHFKGAQRKPYMLKYFQKITGSTILP